MKKRGIVWGGVFFFFGLVLALGGPGGCSGGGGDGDGLEGETGDSASSLEAASCAEASTTAVETILNMSGSGQLSGLRVLPGLSSSRDTALVIPTSKALAVTPMAEGFVCSPYMVPSVSTVLATINGTDIDPAGSGSCTIKGETSDLGGTEQFDILLECDSLNGGATMDHVTLDGKIGVIVQAYTGEGDSASVTVYVGSDDLIIGFQESGSTKICDVELGMSETFTFTVYDTYMTHSNTVDGCLSVCGSAYETSGTRSGTYSLD